MILQNNKTALLLAISGPESSGKTTLASALANAHGWSWVPEYSREYLAHTGGSYDADDLVEIALGQYERVTMQMAGIEGVCITDTFILDIIVWNRFKYGYIDERLLELSDALAPDYTLLCKPDLPWKPDPLRENAANRDALYAMFLDELTKLGHSYANISGVGSKRLEMASAEVQTFVQNHLLL